ncbi:MAG: phosphotransferase family protein [Alphaproteobacteria bacterium]|nr:phosphotransferase family protein [Alphaproteobacteria bacterium]
MDAWRERLTAELRELDIVVDDLRPLHGGACQENFAVTAADGRRFALRSDANQSLPGSLGRALEAQIVQTATDHGVQTPPVRAVIPDLVRPGAVAYLMDWAEGVAIGAKIQRDPRLEGARQVLVPQLARALARIHAIRPEHAPDLRPDNPQDARDSDAVTAALRFCRVMMDQMEPRPAMERIWRWLDQNRPDPGPLVLVHGDYRIGNFLVVPDGLSAILDWEFSHWGSAAEDLAWITVRDWRFGRPDLAVGGVGTRAAFLAAYREAGGVPLDADTLRWFEVLGNLRWATGAVFQAQRVLSGAEADLELLAIGRRAAEMEWEALRVVGALPEVPPTRPAKVPVSTDSPDAATLLGGVAKLLASDVVPAIADKGLQFRVRIAAHLAGVAAREAVLSDAYALADLEGLVALGCAGPAPGGGAARAAVLAGRAALAKGLRDHTIPAEAADPVLAGMLARQLSISNPRFALERDLGEDPWTS